MCSLKLLQLFHEEAQRRRHRYIGWKALPEGQASPSSLLLQPRATRSTSLLYLRLVLHLDFHEDAEDVLPEAVAAVHPVLDIPDPVLRLVGVVVPLDLEDDVGVVLLAWHALGRKRRPLRRSRRPPSGSRACHPPLLQPGRRRQHDDLFLLLLGWLLGCRSLLLGCCSWRESTGLWKRVHARVIQTQKPLT